MKKWYCGKWGFCGTRETVGWNDKQYEKKQQRMKDGLTIYSAMTFRHRF